MIFITASAVKRLRSIIDEHPEDPIVRIVLNELGDNRRIFRITLEATPHPNDHVQEIEGLSVAIDEKSAFRMEGVTLDYLEPGGFKFHHPPAHDGDTIQPISLN